MHRLVPLALAAYPPWWRERYGPEAARLVEDLEADGAPAWRIAADLVRGAAAARLRATGMPPEPRLWAGRAKWSLASAMVPVGVLGLFAATLLGAAQAGLSLHPTGGGPDGGGLAGRIAADAWTVQNSAGIAAFLVLLAAWSVLFDGLRRDGHRPRRWALAMLLPFGVVAVGIALSQLRRAAGTRMVTRAAIIHWHGRLVHYTGHFPVPRNELVAVAARVLSDVVGLGGLAATVVVVLAVVARIEPTPRLFGRALWVAYALATDCALLAVSATTYVLAASHTPIPPWLADTPPNPFSPARRGVPGWFPVTVATLVLGAVLALLAARSARRSWAVARLLEHGGEGLPPGVGGAATSA